MCSNHIGATIEKVLRDQDFFFLSKSIGKVHRQEYYIDTSLNSVSYIQGKHGCRQSVIFAADTVFEM